jgi:type III pantothenate kinase
MNLLLDLGNSRLKWALYDNTTLIKQGKSLPHSELTAKQLTQLWQNLRPEKIGISCVGKTDLLHCIESVIDDLWGDTSLCFHAQTQAHAFDVQNGYLHPEKLGVDRWLALLAARQKTLTHTCMVDCGTAITVDILDAKGQHEGGLICAGLNLMQHALACHTADLPFSTRTHPIGLAKETNAAIYSGTLFAACGLIEHIMAKQPKNTTLLLTGGNAPLIAMHLNYPCTIESELVLQGLALTLQSFN